MVEWQRRRPIGPSVAVYRPVMVITRAYLRAVQHAYATEAVRVARNEATQTGLGTVTPSDVPLDIMGAQPVPWHVRHRDLLIGGSVALVGLLVLRHLRKGAVANPAAAKDPSYRGEIKGRPLPIYEDVPPPPSRVMSKAEYVDRFLDLINERTQGHLEQLAESASDTHGETGLLASIEVGRKYLPVEWFAGVHLPEDWLPPWAAFYPMVHIIGWLDFEEDAYKQNERIADMLMKYWLGTGPFRLSAITTQDYRRRAPTQSLHRLDDVVRQTRTRTIDKLIDWAYKIEDSSQRARALRIAVDNPWFGHLRHRDQILAVERMLIDPKNAWRVNWALRVQIHRQNSDAYRESGLSPRLFKVALEEGKYKPITVDWNLIEQDVKLPYKTFVATFAPFGRSASESGIAMQEPVVDRKALWYEVHEKRYKPAADINGIVEFVGWDAIVDMPVKWFSKAMKTLDEPPNKIIGRRNQLRGAAGLAFTFGGNYLQWLKAAKKYHDLDAHDATHWLPVQSVPGLGDFLMRHKDAPLNALKTIASAWPNIPPHIRKGKLRQVLAEAERREYGDVQSLEFARWAKRAELPKSLYQEVERRWIEATEEYAVDTIPSVRVAIPGFVMYKLEKDDPRGLLLGGLTACCQVPGEAGARCAWFGVESPDSNFYVVEDDKGEIVAQSWVWRNGDVIVFDNIEGPAIQSLKTRGDVENLYVKAAQLMLEDPSVEEVRVGQTEDRNPESDTYGEAIDWPWPRPLEAPEALKPIVPPPGAYGRDAYTDATDEQRVLAVSQKGSQVWIVTEKEKSTAVEDVIGVLVDELVSMFEHGGDLNAFRVIGEKIHDLDPDAAEIDYSDDERDDEHGCRVYRRSYELRIYDMRPIGWERMWEATMYDPVTFAHSTTDFCEHYHDEYCTPEEVEWLLSGLGLTETTPDVEPPEAPEASPTGPYGVLYEHEGYREDDLQLVRYSWLSDAEEAMELSKHIMRRDGLENEFTMHLMEQREPEEIAEIREQRAFLAAQRLLPGIAPTTPTVPLTIAEDLRVMEPRLEVDEELIDILTEWTPVQED